MSHPQHVRERDLNTGQLPIVCIGYSSGGLDPLRTIFRKLPNDFFVVIPHLPRERTTRLPELLTSLSGMPARLTSTGVSLAPSQIYIIPPGGEITLRDAAWASALEAPGFFERHHDFPESSSLLSDAAQPLA